METSRIGSPVYSKIYSDIGLPVSSRSSGDVLPPFEKALKLLEPYSLRLALNFEDPANSLYKNTSSGGFNDNNSLATIGDPLYTVIDQSQGGMSNLGPELVENGGFDTDTWWTKGAGVTISGGTANLTASSNGVTAPGTPLVIGKRYLVRVTITSYTSGTLYLSDGTTNFGAWNAVGTYETIITATSTTLSFRAVASATLSFDNVSVREVPGNHPVQGTLAKRPAWGRFPRAEPRRNLLLQSESFLSPWTVATATRTTNATTAPDGTLTATLLSNNQDGYQWWIYQVLTIPIPYTYSVYFKYNGTVQFIQLRDTTGRSANFDIQNGIAGTVTGAGASSTITDAGNGWFRCSLTTSSGGTIVYIHVVPSNTSTWSASSNVDGSFYAWGSQVEAGTTVTDYQRVADQYGGPRNLFTYTEDFSNAAWAKVAVTISGLKVIPTAALSVHTIQQDKSVAIGQPYTVSFEAKADGYSYVVFINAQLGGTFWWNVSNGTTSGGAATIEAVGDGYFRCEIVGVSGATTTSSIRFWISPDQFPNNFSGDGVSGILFRNFQFENGTKATPYQKVVSANDITQSGVPSISGARFDGVDDCLQISNFDLSNTDEITILGGFRALANNSMICELTANSATNLNSFYLFFGVDRTTGFNFLGHGSAVAVQASHVAGGVTSIAPITAAVTATGDISGDIVKIWTNNVLGTNATGDQGTGNYVNSSLFIGQRNATSSPFNGWIIPWLFICGDIVPDDVADKLELVTMKKIGTAL